MREENVSTERINGAGERKKRMLTHAFAEFCLRPVLRRAVLTYFETPEKAVLAGERAWNEFFSFAERLEITEKERERILHIRQLDFERLYERLSENGIGFVTAGEKEYPEQLRPLYDAPGWLYYKGTLPKEGEVRLAVVGARKCTPYGSETARGLAGAVAACGMEIVSGLAYGVDRAAHEGAMAAGGRTYAVLGCGADICYPAEHREVYKRILETGGGILSEYPPGTKPLPWLFPQRNRIIAGLSDGILVTEARRRSGSLITVSLGLEYGKNIYAVPGRVTDVVSEGCNDMIREGAKPVFSAEDILEDYKECLMKKRGGRGKKKEINYKNFKNILATEEKMVYASLRLRSKHIEELQEETKLSPDRLAEVLYALCEQGSIKRYGQAHYALAGDYKTFLSER